MGKQEPGKLLRRYEAGEHEAVWAELTALGAKVREAPHFEEAWAVARETMRRARHNVELIVRRLDVMGYRFWNGKQGKAKGPPRRVTFGDKVIEASPLGALLAAMFDEARRLPPARITPVMLDQLRNIYQLAMYPWQDRTLLLKGQRLSVDAELRALFDQAKRAAPGQLAAAAIERLHALHLSAFAEAADYWRQKGEDPPGLRETKEAEERQRQESQITDHLKDKKVFCAPGKKSVALVRKLEKRGVFVPLSLRAWIEEVGEVNLAGAHPRLCFWQDENFPGIYADPLMVAPPMWEIEAWHDEGESGAEQEPLDAVVGWDARAKARLVVEDEQLDHGYSMRLPDAAADGALIGEPHNTSFVGYLRLAFRWGGFPGWEEHKDRPEAELATLRDGLLPL